MTVEPRNLAPEAIEAALRSTRFRREREADWAALEDILRVAEKHGTGALDYDQARDLARLYRRTVNALSVARDISLDRALLTYLEALTQRAYLAVYAPQTRPAGLIARFFRESAPRAVRAQWRAIFIAFAALMLGTLLGGLLYQVDPAFFDLMVPRNLAGGRGPGASTEDLRAVIYHDQPGDGLAAFAAYLLSNNTMVAVLAFGVGAFGAAPAILLLVYNGAMLGVFLALHIERGLGWDLGGWLSVHGVTELGAIIIAGAGGIALGLAVLFPGPRTRRAALRATGGNATKLALVAGLMLIAAALLEGFARQTVQDMGARYAIGWGVGALWLLWFLLGGRGAGRR